MQRPSLLVARNSRLSRTWSMAFFKGTDGLMARDAAWTHAMDASHARAYDPVAYEYEREDAFDLPPVNQFPFGDASPRESALYEPFPTDFRSERDEFGDEASVHSDEFMDAEAFMATHKPGEDSFLREATGDDAPAAWTESEELMLQANEDGGRRASDIFVPKSRNMENVEFSSPKKSHHRSIFGHHQTPAKAKSRASLSYGISNTAFSTSNAQDTAASSEFEIHVDNRLVLTPNSFKYLQSQQQERMTHDNFSLSQSKASSTDVAHESHSIHAKQVVEAHTTILSVAPDAPEPRPSSAEKAMHAGPAVIKKALHEIEAMLHAPDFDDGQSDPDPALEKLRVRLRDFPPPASLPDDSAPTSRRASVAEVKPTTEEKSQQVERSQRRSEGVQADFDFVLEAGVQTDSYRGASIQHRFVQTSETSGRSVASVLESSKPNAAPEVDFSGDDPRPARSKSPLTPAKVEESNQVIGENDEHDTPDAAHRIRQRDGKPARPAVPRRGTSFRTAALRQSLDLATRQQKRPEFENFDYDTPVQTAAKVKRGASVLKKDLSTMLDGPKTIAVSSEANRSLPLATALPTQMARRCRRFLCSIGERMSEQIVFTNGSNKVGRICVSTLPLSMGCQQFTVSPAVLELQPFSKSAFLVTFTADTPGVVAGIFQFRAVGIDCLYEPYEVLIEASVRADLQLPSHLEQPLKPPRAPVRPIKSSPKASRVTELPPQTLSGVEIAPTFLRFSASPLNSNQEEPAMPRLFVRVTNTTDETQKVRVKCPHEHLQLTPSKANVAAGAFIEVEVIPLCRPYGRDGRGEDWCGTITVVGGEVQREVSVVIDRKCMALLPSFDDLARVRQAISTQTDSFYFTKKVNRRGLYFHARAVECGSCVVGESHQVPVYICNGSDAPMTVFLQSLQDPFTCSYQPTTLQARKFIEVPIVFNPKAAGKVATCLVAYTVSGKAAVTLIARGVDKPVASGLVSA